jgi:hypothetical protein
LVVVPEARGVEIMSAFLETVIDHQEQWAALNERFKSAQENLDEAERLVTVDVDAGLELFCDLARDFELEQDVARLRILMQLNLGMAFANKLILADAMGARPEAVAEALKVEPTITLEAWLMRGPPVQTDWVQP